MDCVDVRAHPWFATPCLRFLLPIFIVLLHGLVIKGMDYLGGRFAVPAVTFRARVEHYVLAPVITMVAAFWVRSDLVKIFMYK